MERYAASKADRAGDDSVDVSVVGYHSSYQIGASQNVPVGVIGGSGIETRNVYLPYSSILTSVRDPGWG